MKNWKSWWLIALCAFLLSWAGSWAWAQWANDSWSLTSKSWWSLETILAYAWWALAITFVFLKGYEGKNWLEGVRFGTYMWAIMLGAWWIGNMVPASNWALWAASHWASFAVLGFAMWWAASWCKKECAHCKSA